MVLGDVHRKVGVVLLHRASVLSCHAAADRSSGGQLRAPLHVPIPESASEEDANVRPHLEPKNAVPRSLIEAHGLWLLEVRRLGS